MSADPAPPDGSLLRKYLLLGTFVRRPGATIADAAVLSALIERFNEAAGAAWPSLTALAEDSGRDRRTVQRSLLRLVAAQFVEVLRRGGGGRTSARYRPRFGAGAPMPLARGGADAAPRGGADAAPRTLEAARMPPLEAAPAPPEPIPLNPQGFRGVGGACAVVSPVGESTAAPPAPPPGIDPARWVRLLGARPDLNAAEVLEAVEYHRAAGCPVDELNRSIDGLRLNRGHRSLSPNYRRARPARKPKTALEENPRPANRAPAAAPRPTFSGNVVRIQLPVHPLQAKFRRIAGNGNVMAAEKARARERIQREFPEVAPAIVAKPGTAWPHVTGEMQARIAAALDDEWSLCAARIKVKRDAFKARHAPR